MAGPGQALVLPVLLCCLCPGAANLECNGRVWIEPGPVVLLGSDISIGCESWLGCPSPQQLLIVLNYSSTQALPGEAVRLHLPRFQLPFATVTCFSHCAQRHRLVCGTELRAGYPPEPPGNLSCAIAEGSERLRCGWERGRTTHLPTRHSLHLRRVVAQDEEEEDDEEEKTFPADSPVLLRELHNASQYWVWAQASNALGTARSAPRRLSLQELVVPALPVPMGAETTDTSPASTTTRWRSRTRLRDLRCQERHRARGTPAWHVEPCDKVPPEGPRWQHELQSDTEFEFQARCRLGSARSPWSAWSPPFLYRTPEAGGLSAGDSPLWHLPALAPLSPPWGGSKPCGCGTWGHGAVVALAALGMAGLDVLGELSRPSRSHGPQCLACCPGWKKPHRPWCRDKSPWP
ncbi:interleukin-23 receptor isoform 2-T2 [Geothlypis trichas]